MRHISLRAFRIYGAKALDAVPQGETVLLSGQMGPAYFLVPVMDDTAAQERELRRAMAKAGLRASWDQAEAAGLDQLSDREMASEIAVVRRRHRR